MSQPSNIARRYFLRECGIGLGKIAGASLLANGLARAEQPTPFPLKKPHHAPKAKAVIHLFMAGAPSHLDLFDYKPELVKWEGKSLPDSVTSKQRFAFIRADAAVMGPRFKFKKFGKAGTEIAEILPNIGKMLDHGCLIRSVQTDQFNHAPAQIFLNTGFSQPGRPSLGSWVLYGLGSEANDLPSFVVMSTGNGISGGAANWSSGFLPSTYTGVRFRNQGDPILNVQRPPGVDEQLQRESLDAISQLNRKRFDVVNDPEIQTRIASYELAFKLQRSAPDLMDLTKETKETLNLYGADPAKPSFARACVLARRMVERGVRFINIYHEGWDAHSDLSGNHTNMAKTVDQASAALVTDLKQRGMLDSTLVIWGGEFGRTPMVESNPVLGRSNGRDHLPTAFSMWMAGGGIKPGVVHGGTDELGYQAVDKPVHVHDLQATILHTLGLDHERLTYKYAGRDFRLTDVHGHVVKEILS